MANQDYTSLLKKGVLSINKTIEAQKDAISNLETQYNTDEFSQVHLWKSLDILLSTKIKGGKVVTCGVGKSYKICCKITATLNSLSIQSVALHPTEALHGDLGVLNDKDCILMLTASGNTPELINLLPHISKSIPIVLLTCGKDSKLASSNQVKSLLYTQLPSHLKEESIHGIPAPTVSATLSLILADSVVLALAELLEEDVLTRRKMFSIKHPGGSIGANLSHLNDNITPNRSNKTNVTYVNDKIVPTKSSTKSSSFSDSSATSVKTSKPCSKTSSYSSILSLGQIWNGLHIGSPEATSVNSSDDEVFIDEVLATKIKSSNKVFTCSLEKASSVTELDFLKNITLFDYWVITGSINLGSDCEELKKLYSNNGWDELSMKLTSNFKNIG
ncbi:hypothetical protein CLIB1444_02S08416 [[Candida] jaroonii]|uniref:Uncharacterized protein n=1 Tax=[Candida] jaroonii TaxID=467808 RepID=A0ACA9Y3A0_9ASCO|nr:hypothetical protein CLIB1444_02S08416 [[Candida] jaroonii]